MKISRPTLIVLLAFCCFNNTSVFAQPCSVPKPTQLTVINVQSDHVTFTWDSVPNAAYYKVKYKKQGSSNPWSPKVDVGNVTNYLIAGLAPATTYTFSVAAFCDNDKSSGNRTVTGTTNPCTAPTITSIQNNSSSSVTIEWAGCASNYNQIRYRLPGAQWVYESTGAIETVTLNNLLSNYTYSFQVNENLDTTNNWSALDTFLLHSEITTPVRPNILLIVLDDARFDSYSCNGAPAFFHSPNIDRIANEGVNFKTSFAVESYCIPSRGSIVTGLYPHKHGATDNSSNINPDLPTTATILDSAGYITAWIGKYHMAVTPQRGYNYWFATKVNSGTDEYNNMKYNYNGVQKTVNGHDTEILTDTMLAFLDRNSSNKFFATVAYHAPHNPYIPQLAYNGIYSGENMPVPSNTNRYGANYPSCIYSMNSKHYIDASDVADNYEKYYELMAGVDAGIGKIIQKLTDLSLLDSTIIIFTSDNGFMLGEHGFFMKQLAYDPSSRVPMFIRYPAWFSSNIVITDQMALNIDIAPTILEAAGITGHYSFDGVSMKSLANHLVSRTSMYYEYVYNPGSGDLPYIRSVRTLDSRLVNYGCDQSVQEFFDLDVDPNENINRIYDSNYATTVSSLNNDLNTFNKNLDDIIETKVSCSMLNVQMKDGADMQIDEEDVPDLEDNLALFPNPASDQLSVAFTAAAETRGTVFIYDLLGTVLQRTDIDITKGVNTVGLKLDDNLPSGTYTLTISTNDVTITRPFLIEK